jgi:hypothetical protein
MAASLDTHSALAKAGLTEMQSAAKSLIGSSYWYDVFNQLRNNQSPAFANALT